MAESSTMSTFIFFTCCNTLISVSLYSQENSLAIMCLVRKCQLMRSRQKRSFLFVNAFAEQGEVIVLAMSITKQMVLYEQPLFSITHSVWLISLLYLSPSSGLWFSGIGLLIIFCNTAPVWVLNCIFLPNLPPTLCPAILIFFSFRIC